MTAEVANDTRTRILIAAADCIADEGLAQVRMASIAKAAGVSTALLHYHFDTKERLFEQVVAYSYDASSELDLNALKGAGVSAADRLGAYLNRCLPTDEALTRDWLLWQELNLLCLRTPELSRVGNDLYDRLYATIEEILTDGNDANEFDCRPGDVARAAVALCDGLGNRVLAADTNLTLTDAQEIVAETVGQLSGYGKPLPIPGLRTGGLARLRRIAGGR